MLIVACLVDFEYHKELALQAHALFSPAVPLLCPVTSVVFC